MPPGNWKRFGVIWQGGPCGDHTAGLSAEIEGMVKRQHCCYDASIETAFHYVFSLHLALPPPLCGGNPSPLPANRLKCYCTDREGQVELGQTICLDCERPPICAAVAQIVALECAGCGATYWQILPRFSCPCDQTPAWARTFAKTAYGSHPDLSGQPATPRTDGWGMVRALDLR